MSKKNCPHCRKHPAQSHAILGILPCQSCQDKTKKLTRPGSQVEYTTDSIRLQRLEYADDIEQPHYKGKLNKKWIEINGEEAARNQGFSDREIKQAGYVFDGADVRYYNDKT